MNYSIDLADYGYNGECTPDVARVSAVHKERYGLITPFGMTYGFLKPGSYMLGDQPYPTAGDFVRIEFNPSGDSRIIETLPRRSLFSRMEAGPLMREQAVAANFDYVLLVTSLNHDFNPRRMERYLTVAFNSGASPVIVLTKADLCPDYQSKIAEMEISATGVPVHAVSVYTGLGMDALRQYARPRATLVLLGSSGVGKSSLLNALAGSYEMRVNSTRDVDSSKGRHTTTHRQLIMLDSGAMVIDTPGMRELGMWCAGDGWTRRSRMWRRCLRAAAGFPTAATKASRAVRCARRWKTASLTWSAGAGTRHFRQKIAEATNARPLNAKDRSI